MRSSLYFRIIICFSIMLTWHSVMPGQTQTLRQALDSLKNAVLSAPDDTNKVKTYQLLARQNAMLSDYKYSLLYMDSSEHLSRKLGWKKGENFALNYRALISTYELNDAEALRYSLLALESSKETKDLYNTALAYSTNGLVHEFQSNLEEAYIHFKKSLDLVQSIKDPWLRGVIFSRLGNYYVDSGNYEKARHYHREALINRMKDKDHRGVADSYLLIGNTYLMTGHPELAVKDIQTALEIYLKLDDQKRLTEAYGSIGDLYLSLKQYKKAEEMLLKSVICGERSRHLSSVLGTYWSLTRLHEEQNNYEKAFAYQSKYLQIKDSIYSREKTTAVAAEQMKFNARQEEVIRKMEADKKESEHQAALKQQQIIIWSVVMLILLLTVFTLYVFRTLTLTRKQKLIIEEKNRQVEDKQKEILDSIHYAKRIQTSLMPSEKYLEAKLKKSRYDSARRD